MFVPALADQDYQNRLELQHTYRTGVGFKRRPKLIEMPYIGWSKEYETPEGHAKLFRVIQELSDYMIFNRSGIFNNENPNQPYLVDAVKGILNQKDYYNAQFTYGEEGFTPMKDNNFFYSAKQHLTSQIFNAPFQFSCQNISNEIAEKQAKKAAKKASKMATNLLAEFAAANGQDLSFIEDPSINMSGDVDEILAQLNEKEQLEQIMFKIISDINYRHDIRSLERDCFSDMFDINSEFAFVEVINGDVRARRLRPEQVLWVAGDPEIRTLEDDSVIAASVNDYSTFTEIINKYSFQLNTGTGARGLLDAIQRLRQGAMQHYNPDRPYFSETYLASGAISDPDYAGPMSRDVFARVDYNQNFYPFSRNAAGINYRILDQKIYFKMIVPRRYVCEINGQKPTKREFEDWKKGNFTREKNASFTEIDPEGTAPKDKFIVDSHRPELWEATRIGDRCLINVGRYQYMSTKKGRSGYVGMPIVMQASYEKSFAAIGYHLNVLSNILYNRIEELLIDVGHSSAVLFDESIGGDPHSFKFNMKKTGIGFFNSMQMARGNANKYQHFDVIQIGSELKDVSEMLNMIGLLKVLYENMVGASPQAQGQAQDYAGLRETQLNIQNQSGLAQSKFNQHHLFMNQVLQRIADVAKHEYAKDEYINVRVSADANERLKTSRDLSSGDFDVLLRYGPDLKGQKNAIDMAIQQLMAAGGIEMLEPLIDILITDNPSEARAILRQNSARLIELQRQRDKQMAEANKLNAQAQSEKNKIPVVVAKVNQETAFGVADKKMDERMESEKIRGQASDIKHYQDQSNRVLESDLRMDEKEYQEDRNIERDTSLKAMDQLLAPEPTAAPNGNSN